MKKSKQNKTSKKALILFSGGLDSRLAVKLMEEQLGKQNIECINFILPFGEGCCSSHCSLNFCQKENMKLKVIDCTKGKLLEEYLSLIRKPKYGRGTALNPCIDCRIFLLNKAKKYAEKNKIEIIVTGEVLGERPMSQHKNALFLIEKEAKLEGKLLRPLSAKLLPPTEAEKASLIDRGKLLDIQGRSRKKQIELAGKYKISFPSPAGGCLLCEPEFAKKLSPLLNKKLNEQDIQLLKIGRHFQESKMILGRNKQENETLEKSKGIKIIPIQPGPTALIKSRKYEEKAKQLIRKYSKHEISKFFIISEF